MGGGPLGGQANFGNAKILTALFLKYLPKHDALLKGGPWDLDKEPGVWPHTDRAGAGYDLLGHDHLHRCSKIQGPPLLKSYKVSKSFGTSVLEILFKCCSTSSRYTPNGDISRASSLATLHTGRLGDVDVTGLVTDPESSNADSGIAERWDQW